MFSQTFKLPIYPIYPYIYIYIYNNILYYLLLLFTLFTYPANTATTVSYHKQYFVYHKQYSKQLPLTPYRQVCQWENVNGNGKLLFTGNLFLNKREKSFGSFKTIYILRSN